MKKNFIYKGKKLHEISFPLGGIGTGCIGLAGNGRLLDWEIFNRPSKEGNTNGFSFFAIKAEQEENVLWARVLNGDLNPPYVGKRYGVFGYGFGVNREYMAAFPHFREVSFRLKNGVLHFRSYVNIGVDEITVFIYNGD